MYHKQSILYHKYLKQIVRLHQYNTVTLRISRSSFVVFLNSSKTNQIIG